MNNFGHALRVAMAERGMKVADLAAASGVHKNTIWNHLNGSSIPLASQLVAYAGALRLEWIISAPATGLEPVTYRSTAQQTQGSAA